MIMEAIKAKNPEEAERLATVHINNAYKNMVKNGLKEAYSNE
jgi:DNA-binding GntR family transcriptional regulator